MKVPLSEPTIDENDRQAILSSLKTPHLTDGPKLRKFEKIFSKITNAKFGIGVSNGTSALFLSLLGLDIGKGHEVIVPDMTFIATANSVLATGAKPIPVDVDETLNISLDEIEKKITKKTKAIIPVHFAGYPCDMKKIKKLSRKYDLKIIEDCAHAFGAFYECKHVGTFGDAGCFSFYPTKNITTIEGGMIISNSKFLTNKIYSLRNHGLSKTLVERNNHSEPWDYDIVVPGHNFRLDEVRSSLGISQIKKFRKFKENRINAAKYYNDFFSKIDGIELLPYREIKNHVYHLYIIKITKKFGLSRNKAHKKLYELGIGTTVHYKPLHKFSIFKKYNLKEFDFKITNQAFDECLSIPLFASITRKQQNYVISSIKSLGK
jgi:dTDP-4-amino-4,6-dideoxygalactose transaminase